MKYYELIENPTGSAYEELIKVLCNHSDKFYFVTRKELKYNKNIIEKFRPYMLHIYKSKEWASTRTSGPAATVYEIAVNDETRKLLLTLADSLYEWVAPNLPEDLTFLKNDFSWFYSCSHEGFAQFDIRSTYYEQIIAGFRNIKIKEVTE